MVDLARGCDTLQVQVCQGITGAPLMRQLKEAFTSSRGDMTTVGWPTVMTNRIALGLAGFYFGGRNASSTPSYHLTAADFPRSSQEEMDRHVVPIHEKMEPVRALL